MNPSLLMSCYVLATTRALYFKSVCKYILSQGSLEDVRDILTKAMKKFMRPLITLGLGLVLALVSAALTYSAPPIATGNLAAAALFVQPTKTPQPEGLSEIGSTDGIVIMGFVIALIIILPILLRRKSWMETR